MNVPLKQGKPVVVVVLELLELLEVEVVVEAVVAPGTVEDVVEDVEDVVVVVELVVAPATKNSILLMLLPPKLKSSSSMSPGLSVTQSRGYPTPDVILVPLGGLNMSLLLASLSCVEPRDVAVILMSAGLKLSAQLPMALSKYGPGPLADQEPAPQLRSSPDQNVLSV